VAKVSGCRLLEATAVAETAVAAPSLAAVI
jgi:hypothetical protein